MEGRRPRCWRCLAASAWRRACCDGGGQHAYARALGGSAGEGAGQGDAAQRLAERVPRRGLGKAVRCCRMGGASACSAGWGFSRAKQGALK